MFTATHRLPSGVALFIASSSASADIILESGPVSGSMFILWAIVGFIALVLMGLWQDRYVDPVEHDPTRQKKLAFHRGFGGFVALLVGFLSGAAFLWTFGPMIVFSTKPWMSPFGQDFAQIVVTLVAVMTFAFLALYLPSMLFQLRRAIRKGPHKEPTTAQVSS